MRAVRILVVVAATLLASCGGGATSQPPDDGVSASDLETHETAGTIPGPGPSVSELVIEADANLAPGDPGGVRVVASGRISDSAVAVIVRNMTHDSVRDIAVQAAADDVRGASEPVVPTVLHPGEWGLAFVLFDASAPEPDALAFEIIDAESDRISAGVTLKGEPDRTDPTAPIVGKIVNPRVTDLVEPRVDVLCVRDGQPFVAYRVAPLTQRLGPHAAERFEAPVTSPCASFVAVGWARSD